MKKYVYCRGFSLVELSIVLVILGLLVGGVMAGQSLIKASQTRKIITELDQYKTATNIFSDRFFGLPGDLPNATEFWPTGGTGDGDGRICENANICAVGVYENQKYWQNLALAGLLGGYTISNGGGGSWSMSPVSGYPKAIWGFSWGCIQPNNTTGTCGNMFSLGAAYPGWPVPTYYGINPRDGFLTTADAYSFDMKVDDGKAQSGFVLSRTAAGNGSTYAATDCTDVAWVKTDYNMASTATGCFLQFVYQRK